MWLGFTILVVLLGASSVLGDVNTPGCYGTRSYYFKSNATSMLYTNNPTSMVNTSDFTMFAWVQGDRFADPLGKEFVSFTIPGFSLTGYDAYTGVEFYLDGLSYATNMSLTFYNFSTNRLSDLDMYIQGPSLWQTWISSDGGNANTDANIKFSNCNITFDMNAPAEVPDSGPVCAGGKAYYRPTNKDSGEFFGDSTNPRTNFNDYFNNNHTKNGRWQIRYRNDRPGFNGTLFTVDKVVITFAIQPPTFYVVASMGDNETGMALAFDQDRYLTVLAGSQPVCRYETTKLIISLFNRWVNVYVRRIGDTITFGYNTTTETPASCNTALFKPLKSAPVMRIGGTGVDSSGNVLQAFPGLIGEVQVYNSGLNLTAGMQDFSRRRHASTIISQGNLKFWADFRNGPNCLSYNRVNNDSLLSVGTSSFHGPSSDCNFLPGIDLY